jgi:multiple sugar transport system substrate-binding protein
MPNGSRSFSALVLAAVLTAACTGGDDASPPGQADGSQLEASTLNLWVFEGEESFLPALKAGFEKEHPNIEVKITEIPEDNYVTKIDTALAADRPPDIGFVYERRWIKAGRLLALDDVIASHGIDVSTLNQNAFASCEYEGQIYCLGSYTGAVMLFYNKDLFDAAGLPYPSATEPMTVDEYADVAAQLAQPSDDIAKYVWGGTAEATLWWMDVRTLFSEDGRTTAGYVNDPATVHSFDVLAKMVRDGIAPSESDFELFGDEDMMTTGQLAMSITDNVAAIPALEAANIDYGVAPVPVEQQGDPPWVGSWTDQWGVFSGGENAEAAKEFVAFVGTEGNRLRAERGDSLPLDLEIAQQTGWAATNDGRREAIDVIGLARPPVFVPGYWDVTDPLWDTFALIVQGDQTAQQGLDEAAPDMQETLDRSWQTWDDIS